VINNFFFNKFDEKGFIDMMEFFFFQPIKEMSSSNISTSCSLCLKRMNKKLKSFQRIYKNSHFYRYILSKYGILRVSINFFHNLFPTLKENRNINPSLLNINEFDKIEGYTSFNNLFDVSIFNKENDPEKLYLVKYNLPKNIIDSSDLLLKFFKNKLNDIDYANFTNLGRKINYLKDQIQNLVPNYVPDLDLNESKKVSFILTIRYLNIEKIFPLLTDSFIEEIFQDSMENKIYINHNKYGRCLTHIQLDFNEIESLKTHLILESKQRLDEQHPSLVHFMNNAFFNSRFSIDISPSHWKDVALDIRKLNKMVYTLGDLIKLGTLSIQMASFLVFCILYRKNITIVGEVNSGKTTFLNALDLYAPKEFRKIYIEETIETLEFPADSAHQLKYVVEPELNEENNNKEKEIFKLLHRSGDLIILGEILSKLETIALFHCLSAGLRGFQTTHASSIQGLINRWLIHFQIDKNCLNDLDIIVMMRKIGNKRIVQSISELTYNDERKKVESFQFFEYNPINENWDLPTQVENSKLLKNINKIINLSQEKYNQINSLLNSMFIDEINKDSLDKRTIFLPLKEIYQKLKIIDQNIGGV
jgi:Flp pilus assembly CpaF family ATPase